MISLVPNSSDGTTLISTLGRHFSATVMTGAGAGPADPLAIAGAATTTPPYGYPGRRWWWRSAGGMGLPNPKALAEPAAPPAETAPPFAKTWPAMVARPNAATHIIHNPLDIVQVCRDQAWWSRWL